MRFLVGLMSAGVAAGCGEVLLNERDASVGDGAGARFELVIVLAGGGEGRVVSMPSGIECGTVCRASFEAGVEVVLTASAAAGSELAAWSGAPCGSSSACRVVVDRDLELTAMFETMKHLVTVTRLGDGTGSVTSDVAGIDCGIDCGERYPSGAMITLVATPTGRSMFGGWSGACTGLATTCRLGVDRMHEVGAAFDLDRVTLTVATAGPGAGVVSSDLGNIECPGVCSDNYPNGAIVTLTAEPDGESVFAGWTGSTCAGTGPCTLELSSAQAVTARFDRLMHTLTVNKTGSGSGTVTSQPPGIDCGATCSADFSTNTTITLTAEPAPNSTFIGWSGAGCRGTGSCTVELDAAAAVTVTFELITFPLSVSKAGAGDGTIVSQPTGIDCGASCTELYVAGASVTLTATPLGAAVFDGWTGDCSGITCQLTIDGPKNAIATFRIVPSIASPIGVVSGAHNCAINSTGALRCWGYGSRGQTGYGHTMTIGNTAGNTPLAAGDVPIGTAVTQVSVAEEHTCVVLKNGAVRCWGRGAEGRLGYGNTNNLGGTSGTTPNLIGDVPLGGSARQVVTGVLHSCALLATGNVRCWGDGSAGQLGYGNTSDIGDDETPDSAGDVPIGAVVTQLAAGGGFTCALLSTGSVRCWGANEFGQLGYGHTNRVGDTPGNTPAIAGDALIGAPVVGIAAGHSHACAVLNTGNIRCWGDGAFGKLGYGNTNNVGSTSANTPAIAGDVPVGAAVAQISASTWHTCAVLRTTGSLRCWGSGSAGCLGYGSEAHVGGASVSLPRDIGNVPTGGAITLVAAGYERTCALYGAGNIRCWGWNDVGQLGYGDTVQRGNTPSTVPSMIGDVPVF
jgi:alpha-tubulin suppressor-like RCC1 family protein